MILGNYNNIVDTFIDEILPGHPCLNYQGEIETIIGKIGTNIQIGRSCALINGILQITSNHCLIGTDGNFYSVEPVLHWRRYTTNYVVKNFIVARMSDMSCADNLIQPLTVGQTVWGTGKPVKIESIEVFTNNDPNLIGYDFSTSLTGTICCNGIALNARRNLLWDFQHHQLMPATTQLTIIYDKQDNKIKVLYDQDPLQITNSYMIWNDFRLQFEEPQSCTIPQKTGNIVIVA